MDNNDVQPADAQPAEEVSADENLMGIGDSFDDLETIELEQVATDEPGADDSEADSDEETADSETEGDELEEDDEAGGEDEDEESDDSEEDDEAEEDGSEGDDEDLIDAEGMKKGQEYINRKIGKQVKQRKLAVEHSEKLEKELDTVRGELVKQQQDMTSSAVAAAGVDPMFAMEPQELLQTEAKLKQVVRQLEPLAFNPDGYDEGDKHFTQQEVIQQVSVYKDQLDRVNAAKGVIQQRMQTEQSARAVYPEAFDGKSELAVVRASARRSVPGLAAVPNEAVLVSDMFVGAKVREVLGEDGPLLPKVLALLEGSKVEPTVKPKKMKKAKAERTPSPRVKPKAKPPRKAKPDQKRYEEADSFEELAEAESKG